MFEHVGGQFVGARVDGFNSPGRRPWYGRLMGVLGLSNEWCGVVFRRGLVAERVSAAKGGW